MKVSEIVFGIVLTLIMSSCVFLSEEKPQQSVEIPKKVKVDSPLILDDKGAEQFQLSGNMTLIYIDSSGNQIVRRGE